MSLRQIGIFRVLSFFYKAIHGNIDTDVSKYIILNIHPSTRRGPTADYCLTVRACKTSTYFGHIARLWNTVCSTASSDSFTSPSSLNSLLIIVFWPVRGPSLIIFYFFPSGHGIWLVLSAVRIFLSPTTVTVTLSWVFFCEFFFVWELGKNK